MAITRRNVGVTVYQPILIVGEEVGGRRPNGRGSGPMDGCGGRVSPSPIQPPPQWRLGVFTGRIERYSTPATPDTTLDF